MKIILEVLPSKIDYKEDYEAILKDSKKKLFPVSSMVSGQSPDFIYIYWVVGAAPL